MKNTKIEKMQRLVPPVGYWQDWEETSTGFIIQNDTVNKKISYAELAEIDPRLPGAVRCIKSLRSPTHGPQFDIAMTIEVWDAPIHVLSSTYKEVGLLSTAGFTIKDKTVLFRGTAIEYKTMAIPHTDLTAPILVAGYLFNTAVRKSWLNDNYAEWETRLALANDLGLDPDTTARLMFKLFEPTAISVSLPPDISA